MTDDSIEGLLKNLKQTLDIDSKDKSGFKKEQEISSKNSFQEPSVFVLKKKDDKRNGVDNNLLRENVLSHVESEVIRFVVDFCSSDAGMDYIKLLIVKALEVQEDFIKKTLKEEISRKIQEVLGSK